MVFLILAQTGSAPAVAPPAAPPAITPAFNYFTWWPTGHEALISAFVLVGSLIVVFGVMLAVRGILGRLRLVRAFLIAAFSMAVYLSIFSFRWWGLFDPADPLAFWINRILVALLLFSGLQALDRLAVIPLLTRGGRVSIPRFIHQIVNILLALFAILIYGSVAFGWDIDRFLAGSAVVSIVLGLALQESLGNFFSGLVMQASPPFAIGDWIICGTFEGRVVDMTWRAVTLHTNDDNFILIPNATVAKAEIVNYHAPTTATARSVKVGLESELPPAEAIAVLKAAAIETPGVMDKPEPFVYFEDFGDSAVTYVLKFWIKEPAKHHSIEHDVRVHAWYRLREKGIVLPNPIRMVEHISQKQKARNLQAAARAHRLNAIESVPLLQPLSAVQKSQLADSASELFLTAGQILFHQNDGGDSFYIIYNGEVDVLVKGEGGEERQVATLKAGDFFGEMSALTGQPRTATIRAAAGGGLACVQIEKQDLLAIFKVDPGIMEKISEVVARRNAEREAVSQGPGNKPAAEAVATQQKSILGRMVRFFRLGNAA